VVVVVVKAKSPKQFNFTRASPARPLRFLLFFIASSFSDDDDDDDDDD
jgi:hypothetical protein